MHVAPVFPCINFCIFALQATEACARQAMYCVRNKESYLKPTAAFHNTIRNMNDHNCCVMVNADSSCQKTTRFGHVCVHSRIIIFNSLLLKCSNRCTKTYANKS